MRRLALSLLALNVVDAVSTQLAVSNGFATELNPLMAWGIAHGFLLFWALKFGMVALGLWILWRMRRHAAKLVDAVLMGAVALYSLLAMYQIGFWLLFSVQ